MATYQEWNQFSGWCRRSGEVNLPAKPDTIARYIEQLKGKGRSAQILARHASAISTAHREAGHVDPIRTEPVQRVLSSLAVEL